MPAFGSCAGLIMLADRVPDGAEGQETFGGIDMTARRNAFGRQVDSFEREVDLRLTARAPAPFHAVFIRAPWVERARRGESIRARPRITVGSSPSGRVRCSRPHSTRN